MTRDFRDERRGGMYWIEKEPYASVTNILKILDKPALRHWYAKQVYLAMVQDPTMDEKEALAAPYKESGKARDRGKTVHSIVESYKHTKEHIGTVPEEYRPYANAFYKWIEDNKIEIQEHEKTVLHKHEHYAGTLDMLVKKNGKGVWIIDVKTGKDIYPESFLQLSAYKHALEVDKGMKIDRMGVLLLGKDSTYKFEEAEDRFDVFLACKALWEWKHAEDLKKIGYF